MDTVEYSIVMRSQIKFLHYRPVDCCVAWTQSKFLLARNVPNTLHIEKLYTIMLASQLWIIQFVI